MKTVEFVETVDEQTKLDVLVEVGSVTIRPSTGKEMHIAATYRHMDVWVERQGNTVVVRAEQEEDFLQRLVRLFNNDHPKADLVIDLPAHCEVMAKTVTGTLEVEGMLAPVAARVITGQMKLHNLSGSVYAKTVTGQLTYTGPLSDDNHRFETVTGEIVLSLPADTNAELSAQTITGSLNCKLPLTNRQEDRHFVGGKLRGTLGSGAGRIKAKITTGSLTVRSLKEKSPELLRKEVEFA
ncbi:MAG: DUF4097 family beta strand repeat protein [Ardenticatenaceae bacterium]|nr:DUF4097 family beta strand repeat protein [Ardenticatenaceae bacterium]